MNDAELQIQLEKHHAASYGWTLSCCSRCPELAEDVLQSAYLKVLNGRAHYDGRADFKTWLFSVIRLTALDEQRRTWLRHFRLSNVEQEPVIAAPMPDDEQERSERLAFFRTALAQLPKRQEQVLHLVFYQGMTLNEASQVIGVSLGSVRTHYERGKKNLRAKLGNLNHCKRTWTQTTTI